ncbi:MAG: Protein-L-isoaspartate(D-aspartate) O-methyltransferase [Candidatus Moranbacteria bacterium GW2011_GWF1_36_4]|nr:MAG: Protein-L-isoaspartate(D-aspartate) O-methyltransferase [Candidatus Moranbacteria bacterium GW2011_GWF1_36_4]KKQ21906.1 MAG: Protein-L-isoaspartate(D-aspartate) O-methyltransferase [Candidatus Moranbacteria bacterium GW2011_GWF2_37_11]KKQ47134.1 MAG: Protein-L-isoaspartate(D-aspartate) O-methyltransferase [Candidatus Moranbacteria bacterium GW2011_GWD2_37_9]
MFVFFVKLYFMNRLANNLIQKGVLKSDNIIRAFSEVNRAEFVPSDMVSEAEADIPLPIGYGQTISQPTTVAIMLELLNPEEGQNILDVGSGSGWTTAILACISGERGKVTALERILELCEIGKDNIDKFDFLNKYQIEFQCIDATEGFEKNAPYDRILVSAEVEEIPESFKRQLKIGGKMVIPIHNSICYVEKKSEDDFYVEEFPGFVFVPFIVKSQ